MKMIWLTQGQFTLVDDDIYDYLNKFKWFALKGKNTYYAARNSPRGGDRRPVIWMHRVILCLSNKTSKGDHKDHNGLNNQGYNLRIATSSQNNANTRSRKNSTSLFLGVCWDKEAKKWRALISKNKINTYLGLFDSEIDAAIAYNKEAIKLFGEFANLNKINNHESI